VYVYDANDDHPTRRLWKKVDMSRSLTAVVKKRLTRLYSLSRVLGHFVVFSYRVEAVEISV
jgi:hypothetical protein